MTTFVHRVRLKNYRSIGACDVRLGDLTFLVGPNGSGKSNFLVVAVREFEAWFVAAAESLSQAGRLHAGTTAPPAPEGIRDAKGWLSQRMARGYRPTIDQARLSASFDFAAARTCSSFDKLLREVERLLAGS